MSACKPKVDDGGVIKPVQYGQPPQGKAAILTAAS